MPNSAPRVHLRGAGQMAPDRSREDRMDAPLLLVTGFGPFPGAPDNPTSVLMRALAEVPAARLGASRVEAVALETDYCRSWETLQQLFARVSPDIVVHFGLSALSDRLNVERVARNRADPEKPDIAGFAPGGRLHDDGPETLAATLPSEAIVASLVAAGFPAAPSDDAGLYVCNATLYRSLRAAEGTRRKVGFIHVPPDGVGGFAQERLAAAALVALEAAVAAWTAPEIA